ncbi:MBG domain-containing protein [Rhizobacter sp. Root1221]|uniref:MBG domain-containing protein n=1 Tax=Rhizobacter sp. Root1221 TaxID=1736433 RepID=UPI0035120788
MSTRPLGVSNLPLNGTLAGFVNGDTAASVLAGSLRWSTTAGSNTAAGLYPIVGSGLQVPSGNYVLAQATSNAVGLRITGTPLPAAPSLFLESARPSSEIGNGTCQPGRHEAQGFCHCCNKDAAISNAAPGIAGPTASE